MRSVISYKDVGARIREARGKRGWSQAELASRTKISTSHISDMENGKENFGIEILSRLVETLDVSADWLLCLDASDSLSYNSAVNSLFSDCSPEEVKILMKLMSETKAAIKAAKQN
jgi:transcriptional regulator with XRE-family HTH domain